MSRALHVPPPLTAAGIRGLLSLDDLPHDDVLSAIGGHYGGVVEPVDPLDEAARALFDVVGEPCEVQAKRLMEVLFLHLGLSPDELSADALILPAVVITRRADPLLISMLGHEIARRAGLESHVCIAGEASWTALLDEENCTLVGSSPFAGAGARENGFHVACAHETATVLLERLARRGLGRTRRCAGALAGAMRSGRREVPACAGHPRRA
jgi:Transglutaminase-like superfamily